LVGKQEQIWPDFVPGKQVGLSGLIWQAGKPDVLNFPASPLSPIIRDN
jgi:hypothetical protein